MTHTRFAAFLSLALMAFAVPARAYETKVYTLPNNSYVHDVSPAPNGDIWYTAQREGALGILNPTTGKVRLVKLGKDSAPHGVITAKDGTAWITDGGQNAIVRYDPKTGKIDVWPLPKDTGYTNLNTGVFDKDGHFWFTGQNGFYGRVDAASHEVKVWKAPKGRGAYGMTMTPDGEVWFVSLASSYLAKIDRATGEALVIEPPHANAGTRRVWSDSKGNLWISEWNTGFLDRYTPATQTWKSWQVPGASPQAYGVYVDDKDIVWVSQWGANSVFSFDPATEKFTAVAGSKPEANVRQILGRPGEVWLPQSGAAQIMLVRTGEGSTP